MDKQKNHWKTKRNKGIRKNRNIIKKIIKERKKKERNINHDRITMPINIKKERERKKR